MKDMMRESTIMKTTTTTSDDDDQHHCIIIDDDVVDVTEELSCCSSNSNNSNNNSLRSNSHQPQPQPQPQQNKNSNIEKAASIFVDIVNIQDRLYNNDDINFKQCFVGTEAVDAMIKAGLADTRKEAVELGRSLESELGLFEHVCNPETHNIFKDDFLFYTFNTKKKILKEKASMFVDMVTIQDRKYHLKTYKHCFVGSEAVNAMITAGLVDTREDAVDLARSFESDLKLFQHVCNDHIFKDDYLFYTFNTTNTTEEQEDEPKGGEHNTNPTKQQKQKRRTTKTKKPIQVLVIGGKKKKSSKKDKKKKKQARRRSSSYSELKSLQEESNNWLEGEDDDYIDFIDDDDMSEALSRGSKLAEEAELDCSSRSEGGISMPSLMSYQTTDWFGGDMSSRSCTSHSSFPSTVLSTTKTNTISPAPVILMDHHGGCEHFGDIRNISPFLNDNNKKPQKQHHQQDGRFLDTLSPVLCKYQRFHPTLGCLDKKKKKKKNDNTTMGGGGGDLPPSMIPRRSVDDDDSISRSPTTTAEDTNSNSSPTSFSTTTTTTTTRRRRTATERNKVLAILDRAIKEIKVPRGVLPSKKKKNSYSYDVPLPSPSMIRSPGGDRQRQFQKNTNDSPPIMVKRSTSPMRM